MDLKCSRCQKYKKPEEFAWQRKERGLRDRYCRPCRAAYKQEHYRKHKKRYVAQALERTNRRLDERIAWLVQYLEDHPCIDCGETDVTVLDFDHFGGKLFNVSAGLRYRNWEAVLAEIAKCEVRCANCHRRRTAAKEGPRRFLLASAPRQRQLFF